MNGLITETIREWKRLFSAYLDAGMSKDDIQFEMTHESESILVIFTEKLYNILKEAAKLNGVVDFLHLNTTFHDGRAFILVKCRSKLSMPIHLVIALSLQTIIHKQMEALRKQQAVIVALKEEKSRFRWQYRKEIDFRAMEITRMLSDVKMKDSYFSDKSDDRMFHIKGRKGKNPIHAFGFTPEEVIRDLEKKLQE